MDSISSCVSSVFLISSWFWFCFSAFPGAASYWFLAFDAISFFFFLMNHLKSMIFMFIYLILTKEDIKFIFSLRSAYYSCEHSKLNQSYFSLYGFKNESYPLHWLPPLFCLHCTSVLCWTNVGVFALNFVPLLTEFQQRSLYMYCPDW